MLCLRRAALPLAAAAPTVAAPGAYAAEIRTLPCVAYVAGDQTLPILATGFTPNGLVRVFTRSAAARTPRALGVAPANAMGAFAMSALPPPFVPPDRNRQTFSLIGYDTTNPASPIVATFRFEVVRFGLTRSPLPSRPRQRVTFTARGFRPGRPVYVHFRFAGRTRRTVNLGVARPPCGIASERLPALPARIRYGTWEVYVDQSRRFSQRTRPRWFETFGISRPRRR
jgi:hypothetical protein